MIPEDVFRAEAELRRGREGGSGNSPSARDMLGAVAFLPGPPGLGCTGTPAVGPIGAQRFGRQKCGSWF